MCVLPVPAEQRDVVVDYVEEPEDRNREALLTGERRFFTRHYVDWRLYAGRNSVIEDGESFLRYARRAGDPDSGPCRLPMQLPA